MSMGGGDGYTKGRSFVFLVKIQEEERAEKNIIITSCRFISSLQNFNSNIFIGHAIYFFLSCLRAMYMLIVNISSNRREKIT